MVLIYWLLLDILICASLSLAFPRATRDSGTVSGSPWETLKARWFQDSVDSSSHARTKIAVRQSLYNTHTLSQCGSSYCNAIERCSSRVEECDRLARPYGPPCCVDEALLLPRETVRATKLRDRPQRPRRPAPTVMGHNGYGVPKKSINERCIEEITEAGGSDFNFKKLHTTVRLINKLGEAKFYGDIENKDKEIDYTKPPTEMDVKSLNEDIDTISPCSGFLYQSDVLLSERQMDQILENAIVYVGEPLRHLKLEDIFAEDEFKMLERSPALRHLKRPPAPCPPYSPCPALSLSPAPPAPPPDSFLEQLAVEKTREFPRTVGELAQVFLRHRQKRKISSDPDTRWKFPIRYRIDKSVDVTTVEAGINRWRDSTCITFERTTLAVRKLRGNYLNFVKGDGCHSMVGKNTKEDGQSISIGAGCSKIGTVTHEIGHALGLWHEQARPDRDTSVSILKSNIPKKYLGQFLVQDFKTKGVPYDYGSVMHYAAKAYAKTDKLFSIEAEAYRNTMGQREELSFLDTKVINQAYCKNTCASKKSCKNGGYTDPKACSKCKCPNGLGGICDEPEKTGSSCGTLTLSANGKQKTLEQSGNKECNYLIKASKSISIEVTEVSFTCSKVCKSYVEVKHAKLMGPTGARICCGKKTRKFTSKGSQALILYRGSAGGHKMTVKYKA